MPRTIEIPAQIQAQIEQQAARIASSEANIREANSIVTGMLQAVLALEGVTDGSFALSHDRKTLTVEDRQQP